MEWDCGRPGDVCECWLRLGLLVELGRLMRDERAVRRMVRVCVGLLTAVCR